MGEPVGGKSTPRKHRLPTEPTHPTDYAAADRAKHGIGDGLIRLSIGLEAVEDLQADLEKAFAAVSGEPLARG